VRSQLIRLLVWRRPAERLREFAETEAFGARDLARAAEAVSDVWMRRRLLQHAQDEVRHARLLGDEAAPAREQSLGALVAGETATGTGVDIEHLGEVPFLAFVHVAERRAAAEFALHRQALAGKGAVFDAILADEQRHVAWTGRALERYRAAGRGDEVARALRRLRWERWLAPFRWVGQRLAGVMSAVVLTLLYAVVLPLFVPLAGRRRPGWQQPPELRLDREF
jgi:hypothetical protein